MRNSTSASEKCNPTRRRDCNNKCLSFSLLCRWRRVFTSFPINEQNRKHHQDQIINSDGKRYYCVNKLLKTFRRWKHPDSNSYGITAVMETLRKNPQQRRERQSSCRTKFLVCRHESSVRLPKRSIFGPMFANRGLSALETNVKNHRTEQSGCFCFSALLTTVTWWHAFTHQRSEV